MPKTLYEGNKEGILRWRAKNRDKYNEMHRKYYAKKKQQGKSVTAEIEQVDSENDSGSCPEV
jgi:hypothetical protein